MAKKKEAKPRPEHYKKSNFNINGSFDDAVKMFFVKSKESVKKSSK